MKKLKYDNEKLDYVEEKHSVWYFLRRGVVFLTVSFLIAYPLYMLFSMIVPSKEERIMSARTRVIRREYEELSKKVELLESVMEDLEVKDERIYREIFNSGFPQFTLGTDTASYAYRDTSFGASLVEHTAQRLDYMNKIFSTTERMLSDIYDSVREREGSLSSIPFILPVKECRAENIGASVGWKMHPFYKKLVYHDGMDILSPVGTDVIATADGVVVEIERNKKQSGTRIQIEHGDGYRTVYAHLSDVLVRKGEEVKAGEVIARVGNTGMSFAPHLHYEITKDGEPLDPITFLGGSLSPSDYAGVLFVALNTGQSLD